MALPLLNQLRALAGVSWWIAVSKWIVNMVKAKGRQLPYIVSPVCTQPICMDNDIWSLSLEPSLPTTHTDFGRALVPLYETLTCSTIVKLPRQFCCTVCPCCLTSLCAPLVLPAYCLLLYAPAIPSAYCSLVYEPALLPAYCSLHYDLFVLLAYHFLVHA